MCQMGKVDIHEIDQRCNEQVINQCCQVINGQRPVLVWAGTKDRRQSRVLLLRSWAGKATPKGWRPMWMVMPLTPSTAELQGLEHKWRTSLRARQAWGGVWALPCGPGQAVCLLRASVFSSANSEMQKQLPHGLLGKLDGDTREVVAKGLQHLISQTGWW